MSERYDVAVVGATGLVGQAILDVLAERNFPVDRLHALASARSVGQQVTFGNRKLDVTDLAEFDFSRARIAIFSAGGSVSGDYASKAIAAGCVVIDNTSKFRYDDDVPLVVPEVNGHRIAEGRERGLIANPNCSTIQMVVALKPIYDAVGIRRINVATYQAVSGAGRHALEELVRQTTALLNGRPLELNGGAAQLAFNAVPHIDEFQDNGYTREEMKMVWETHKIFEDERIEVNPTTVRIPVFYGHSEAVSIETDNKISAADVRDLMRSAPGVRLVDDDAGRRYPTAVSDASGRDAVFVGRVREDLTRPNGINLWIVADNIRKGAATNSVQIAEILAKSGL